MFHFIVHIPLTIIDRNYKAHILFMFSGVNYDFTRSERKGVRHSVTLSPIIHVRRPIMLHIQL